MLNSILVLALELRLELGDTNGERLPPMVMEQGILAS
jgi:hypothetical protein